MIYGKYEKGVPLLEQTPALNPHLSAVCGKAAKALIEAINDGRASDWTNTNGDDFVADLPKKVHIRYVDKGISPLTARGEDGATLSVMDGQYIVPGVMGSSVSLDTGRTNTDGMISAARLIGISKKL